MTEVILPNSIDAGTEITAAEHQGNYVALRDSVNGNIEGAAGSYRNVKPNTLSAADLANDPLYYMHGSDVLRQEGAVANGGKVTPGAGLVLNYAAGFLWIKDSNALVTNGGTAPLLPASIGASSVTIAANASGNPRIDQIIATLTGYGTATVSIVQGTATVGATLDNRTGAAALPAGAIRLADILMPNAFGGPFVQNTHIRDRRQWAHGAFASTTLGTVSSLSATSDTTISASLQSRLELGGNPLLVGFNMTTQKDVLAATATYSLYASSNGAAAAAVSSGGSWITSMQAATNRQNPSFTSIATLAAGTHLLDPRYRVSSGNSVLDFITVWYKELIVSNSFNSGA